VKKRFDVKASNRFLFNWDFPRDNAVQREAR